MPCKMRRSTASRWLCGSMRNVTAAMVIAGRIPGTGAEMAVSGVRPGMDIPRVPGTVGITGSGGRGKLKDIHEKL